MTISEMRITFDIILKHIATQFYHLICYFKWLSKWVTHLLKMRNLVIWLQKCFTCTTRTLCCFNGHFFCFHEVLHFQEWLPTLLFMLIGCKWEVLLGGNRSILEWYGGLYGPPKSYHLIMNKVTKLPENHSIRN